MLASLAKYLLVAQRREQPQRQHEVDPDPRGQHAQPPLAGTGLIQHRISQLKRHLPGQLAQMTGSEPPRRYHDRPSVDHLSYRTSVAMSTQPREPLDSRP